MRPRGTARGDGVASSHGVLAILATSALAYSFMQTLVLPALPFLAREFDASPAAVAWVASAFFLSSSVCIPIVGRLGDALGKVRVLAAAMGVLAVASIAAAFAPTLETLVACRVGQGVGGAVFPLAFGIVRDRMAPDRIGAGIGAISAVFGIGSAVGYVVSGLVIEHLDRHWLFGLGAVPAIVSVLLVPTLRETRERSPGRPDWLGAAVGAAGLLALLVAITEGNRWGWASPRTVGLALGGALVLALWGWIERRVADPMVDMAMFARRSMALLNLCTFLIGYAMFSIYTILPGFVSAQPTRVGYGFAASPSAIGLFFVPVAIAMLLVGPPAGGTRRVAPITVLRVGTALLALSLGLIAFARDDRVLLYGWLALLGLGTGACMAVLGRLIVEAVPPEQTGIAGGMNTIMRTIGGAVTGQAGAALVSGFVGPSGAPSAQGYTIAFALAGFGGVGALVCTVALRRVAVGSSARFASATP